MIIFVLKFMLMIGMKYLSMHCVNHLNKKHFLLQFTIIFIKCIVCNLRLKKYQPGGKTACLWWQLTCPSQKNCSLTQYPPDPPEHLLYPTSCPPQFLSTGVAMKDTVLMLLRLGEFSFNLIQTSISWSVVSVASILTTKSFFKMW